VRALAFLIHILTACGAVLALLALLAASRADWPLMFVWLGLALMVDAVDGPLARAVNVSERLPRWSGDVLDLVVDFATYVFVPAYAVVVSGLMPGSWSVLAGAAIVLTGALYFADGEMKTEDNFFRGFPAIWNVVAFYLLLLWPPAWVCAAVIAVLVVFTFVPIRFIHPLRVRRLRALNVTLLALGLVLSIVAVGEGLAPSPWVTVALCALGLYLFGFGIVSGHDASCAEQTGRE
jgi:phosphatidylcholine synthase